MKKNRGFTLVELLVVIAIMGALAALTLGITKSVNEKKIRSRAQREILALSTAIENYKDRLGFYPPMNTAGATFSSIPGFAGHTTNEVPPLFYELSGTKPVGAAYQTVKGDEQIDKADIQKFFGRPGFANSNEETVENFLKDMSMLTYREISTAPDIEVFVSVTPGVSDFAAPAGSANQKPLNPIRYNSLNPTRNPGRFDLWIELQIGDKVETIGNWKD